jgi:hypothetical protein
MVFVVYNVGRTRRGRQSTAHGSTLRECAKSSKNQVANEVEKTQEGG